MTTDSPEPDTDESIEPPTIVPVVPLHQQPDINLVAVAGMADFVGFPLTLYMPWGIASGHTANPNAYYKHLGDSVRAGNTHLPEGVAREWIDAINQFAAINFDRYSEMTPAERTKSNFAGGFNLLSHLVLKDAQCWVGGSAQSVNHNYLRVRLTDVTAWAWGKVT